MPDSHQSNVNALQVEPGKQIKINAHAEKITCLMMPVRNLSQFIEYILWGNPSGEYL